MAITFVKSAGIVATAGFSSVTIGMNTTSGNLFVAHIASYNQTAVPSDSNTNTWINVASYTGGLGRVRIDYVLAGTGGSGHTFTATVPVSDYPTITVQEISWGGATGSFALSNTDFVSGGSGSHSSGNVTTTNAGAVLVGCGSSPSGTSYTVIASFNQDRELDTGSLEGLVTGYYIPGSTATVDFAFTTSNNGAACRSIIAAFYPSAAGSVAPPVGSATMLGAAPRNDRGIIVPTEI